MIVTPVNSWVYTTDRDSWDGEEYFTKDNAVEAGAKEVLPGFDFYVGQLCDVEFELNDVYISEYKVESIIEGLDNTLSDAVGESSEYWTNNITQEQIDELRDKIQAVVFNWIVNSVGQPTTYSIENVEKIEVETGIEEKIDGCY